MKISVQFEANSAEDYDRIIEALSGPGRALFVAPAQVPQVEKPESAPVVTAAPLPDEPESTGFVIDPKPAEFVIVPPGVEAPVKRRPGRPKVMKPVVEEPEEESEPVKGTQEESIPAIVPAPKPVATSLSHLDVKGAFRDYVIRYGTSNGYSDVPQLLTKAFGSEIRKAEHVPNDQSSLKKAIAIITQALNDNPFNRKVANA